MVSLPEAALVAHKKVFSGAMLMSQDTLDIIATALSAHLAIYGVRHPERALMQLTEAEYSSGAFRGGATRFELRDGKSMFSNVAVKRDELTRLLEILSAPRGNPKAPKPSAS